MAEQLSMDDLVSTTMKDTTPTTQPPAEPPIVSAAVQETPQVPPDTKTAAAVSIVKRSHQFAPGNVITIREMADPDVMNQVVRIAGALSICLTDSRDAAKETFARIVAGAELGLPPMASVRMMHFIKGKPVLSADMMVAVAKSNGVKFQIIHSKKPGESCRVSAQRGEEAYSFEWTMEMARTAGLAGDNWRKYPWDMLYARAAAHVCRKLCPDLLGGIYIADEVQEDDAAKVNNTAADLQAGIERLDG